MDVKAPAQALRVIVIDDTPDLRDLLRFALTRHGFDVVAEAGNGRDGITVATAEHPDLILLDMAMPVMDGLEALPHLRRACPQAKIVVLSGFGASEMTRRAEAAGADGYLQKGAPISTIIAYVREVLGRSTEPETPTATTPRVTDSALPPAPPAQPASVLGGHAPSRLAPFAIVELEDSSSLRVLAANPASVALLGEACTPGRPLSDAAPELARLVTLHRREDDALLQSAEADGTGHAFRLRRSGASLLLFAEGPQIENSTLRRAIATTAHEIRSPVSVIMGALEALDDDAESMPEADRRRIRETVVRQARLLDRITADLLAAAQSQRGTLHAETRPVQPAEVIDGVLAHHRDVSVTITDPRSVLADPHRLEQMLDNLLSNASKYAVAPVSVTVRRDGDRVCIDVEDGGPGVPPDFREHLFEEFSRATRGQVPGTGLGLYVVKSLAEAQGGSVSYAQSSHGGSVFTISLLPA